LTLVAAAEGTAFTQVNPASVSISFGGVPRDVTENVARLGRQVSIVSRAGNDEAGRAYNWLGHCVMASQEYSWRVMESGSQSGVTM